MVRVAGSKTAPILTSFLPAAGFRQFLLRDLEQAKLEWDLITPAYTYNRTKGPRPQPLPNGDVSGDFHTHME
jgi:hypothetical protein